MCNVNTHTGIYTITRTHIGMYTSARIHTCDMYTSQVCIQLCMYVYITLTLHCVCARIHTCDMHSILLDGYG